MNIPVFVKVIADWFIMLIGTLFTFLDKKEEAAE